MALVAAQRVRIALRGLRYRARREEEVPVLELRRLDSLGTLATTLGMIDNLRGTLMQGANLLDSLALGEERHVCRSLAVEACFRASLGHSTSARRITTEVELLAQRLGGDDLQAYAKMAAGWVAWFDQRFPDAVRLLELSEQFFARARSERDFELSTTRHMRLFAAGIVGRYRADEEFIFRQIGEARARNDVYTYSLFSATGAVRSYLADDRPEEVLKAAADAVEGWPRGKYYLAHVLGSLAEIQGLTYMRRYRQALDACEVRLRNSQRSGHSRVPWLVIEQSSWMARLAVQAGDPRRALRSVRLLLRQGGPWAVALGTAYLACVARARGDEESERRHLSEAIPLLESAGVEDVLAAAQLQLGRLVGGNEGGRLESAGVAWLNKERIRNPDLLIDCLLPGWLPGPASPALRSARSVAALRARDGQQQ
jgi:hypothetical protein